ncbi:3-methyl-2-oxobutanoate hydroxymethyltransferase [uncultured Gulosibacter sp.]|uniref:3-methyl-2-oxobutanoate hydroxymethyltransferase n=1 Tax=uncultured Gulosibacter sp. TaxID=1339167 RepID=UPI00288BF198|nr:3-methyl-2-oxobutanoate hydroxymethyltransferase [uncultured Gulosibacter sp.]
MNQPEPRKRIRTRHFAQAKAAGHKITALTSYDALTAAIFDAADVDLLLVGDSAANVVLGYQTTLPITADELIPMARAVSGAAQRALVVADLPFGSYENSPEQAWQTASRFMKEANIAAVKLEGGERMAAQIRRLTESGIPVCGHVGFTPQSEHGLGGHVVQGRGAAEAQLLADALAVERAGAFAVVLEMVPADVASRVTEQLQIPTIGIGAGAGCDGQILVWQDAFGLTTGRAPRFVRRYADLAGVLGEATRNYVNDVRSGAYPSDAEIYENTTQ